MSPDEFDWSVMPLATASIRIGSSPARCRAARSRYGAWPGPASACDPAHTSHRACRSGTVLALR
ncbi:conserved hypothetical membrane protein [Mycobacterium marinum E11]|nr:conserved hypothetical membrane protein [Mycobacterium marinum E11]